MRRSLRDHFHPSSFSILLLTLVVALSACSSAAPTPFEPSVTLFVPTAAPTTTPVAESATVTPEPQVVAAVSDTNASTDTSTNAAPVALGADVDPYTGLAVSDASVLQRKPLLIKVANTTDIRPQSGLNSADVVVEHLSEGSITRFTALFLANSPEKVGSVRSCRLIDIELPVMFDAALTCSGTSPGVKPLMRDSYAFKNNLTMISDFGPYECARCPMFRTSDRVPPHNLFANTLNAWKELDKRGVNKPSTFKSWAFDTSAPRGKTTQVIDVGYKSGTVSWTYDTQTGRWLRAVSNTKQTDALTGKQIAMSNVVLVYAHHQTTLIQEDVGGSRSIQIQVWGEGPVRVFRDGREIGGTWKRNSDVGNFEFFDVSGKKIPLKPGNTWIEMVPIKGGDVPVGTR